METLVQGFADLNISIKHLLRYTLLLANNVFGQKWALNEEEDDLEIEERLDISKPGMKRRKLDRTYVLPSRKSILNWMETGALINFKYVAEEVMKSKESESVVVFGIDDTDKAAGHRKHDVNAGHLTVVSKEKVRSNYSVGYLPNITHSGEDSAKAVKYLLSTMASTTYESVKENIDLWMIDRAGEGKLMLSELGAEEEKKHNCNAHIILCGSNCLDKVFRTTEDRIGRENLISTNASHCFNSPRTS